MKEQSHSGGYFTIEHRRGGKLLSYEEVHNTLMDVYPAVVSGLVGGVGGQTAFGYMALGTSNTAISQSQTTLQAETVVSGLARVAVTPTRSTVTKTNDTLTYSHTFTAGGSADIKEVGIFNAASAGVMACRALTTTTKSMAATDTLTITYALKFTN